MYEELNARVASLEIVRVEKHVPKKTFHRLLSLVVHNMEMEKPPLFHHRPELHPAPALSLSRRLVNVAALHETRGVRLALFEIRNQWGPALIV